MSHTASDTLYDTPYWNRTLYSGWQLLLLVEVLGMGLHYLVNFLDADAWRITRENFFNGTPLPSEIAHASLVFGQAHVAREFLTHFDALNALVWFSEEESFSLFQIIGWTNERRLLTQQEQQQYEASRTRCARRALDRYGIEISDVLRLIRFLFDRWSDWTYKDRPLVASEYEQYIARAVMLIRLRQGWDFARVRDEVGRIGGYAPFLRGRFGPSSSFRHTPPVVMMHPTAPVPTLGPVLVVVDQPQDFLEQFPRPQDLGHLEDGVPGMRDDLGAELDELYGPAG